jgi:hypothetical protein
MTNQPDNKRKKNIWSRSFKEDLIFKFDFCSCPRREDWVNSPERVDWVIAIGDLPF